MSIHEKLADGGMALGTFICEVRNPNIAYMMKVCGFDYFVLDTEHGAYNPETVSDMIAAARGAGVDVVVRIPEIRREAVMKPLECGAAGLLVPMVDTADQARQLVQLAKYPPAGVRGAALRRAHSRYEHVPAGEYLAATNERIFLAAQIETTLGVENAEAIAAVEGVDCLFVGPFDLSVSLGIPGQVQHPAEVEAIERVLTACRKHGKAAGILTFEPEPLQRWIERGMRFVAYSSDINMLADAAADAVKQIKAGAVATTAT